MKLIDPTHPFFRTRTRRWATVLLPTAWMVFEIAYGDPLWAGIAAAAAVYALWVLVLRWQEPES